MSHLLCTDKEKHIYIHSVTRRFLLTVKHLCALTVNRLYVNWRYSCSSIADGAPTRHTSSSSGTSSQFQGSSFEAQVFGFLKFTFEDEKDCRQGSIQGHRTICTAEVAFFTSHGIYHRILNLRLSRAFRRRFLPLFHAISVVFYCV